MKQLVLIRHGESVWNQENRFTGWVDVGLSEKGLQEAKNAGLALKKAGFAFESGNDYGTGLAGTDYAAIAAGFGGYGEVVERIEDVQPAIRHAIASGLPAVIDCRVRFEPHPAMPHFAKMSSAGA